jgi:hypothetical protein
VHHASLGGRLHHTRELELHQHHVGHGVRRRTLRLDHVVRRLSVQGITVGQQLAHAGQNVRTLQQGSTPVVSHAPRELFGRRAQVDHRAALAQVLAVVRPEHGTATRGNHRAIIKCRDFLDHLRLNIPKRGLALVLEVHTDRAADTLLDHVVRVDERTVQMTGQLAADSGLARAGQANQGDGGVRRWPCYYG